MTDEELLEDFISFIKKQMRFGSSKAPLLQALMDQYTFYENDKEKIVAGLDKLDAVRLKDGIARIDMQKILA